MDHASKLDMNLLVMHYPPYCSKYNPIEHRLFSQITRSWSGAPLLSIEDASRRAAETTISKGLTCMLTSITKLMIYKDRLTNPMTTRLKK